MTYLIIYLLIGVIVNALAAKKEGGAVTISDAIFCVLLSPGWPLTALIVLFGDKKLF